MMIPFSIRNAERLMTPAGRDCRCRRTLWFFVSKGYLRNTSLAQPYQGRLNLNDVLWACEHLYPELFEVLPAALLKFPGHLKGTAPPDLRQIMDCLGEGATEGPSYRGHPYHRLLGWTKFRTTDGRTKDEVHCRVHLSLPVEVANDLRQLARRTALSQGHLVADALRLYLTSAPAGNLARRPSR